MEPQFMTVEELAELTRSAPSSVRWWVYTGTAPRSVKIGRKRLFAVADVEAWLNDPAREHGRGDRR